MISIHFATGKKLSTPVRYMRKTSFTLLLMSTLLLSCGEAKPSGTVFDKLTVGMTNHQLRQSLKGIFREVDSINVELDKDINGYVFKASYKLIRFAPIYINNVKGVLTAFSFSDTVSRFDWYADSMNLWSKPVYVDSTLTYKHATQNDFKNIGTRFTKSYGDPEEGISEYQKIIFWKKQGVTVRYVGSNSSLIVSKSDIAPLEPSPLEWANRSIIVDQEFMKKKLGFSMKDFLDKNMDRIVASSDVKFVSLDSASDEIIYRQYTIEDTVFGLPGLGMYFFNPSKECVIQIYSSVFDLSKPSMNKLLSAMNIVYGKPEVDLDSTINAEHDISVFSREWGLSDYFVKVSGSNTGFEFFYMKAMPYIKSRRLSGKGQMIPRGM